MAHHDEGQKSGLEVARLCTEHSVSAGPTVAGAAGVAGGAVARGCLLHRTCTDMYLPRGVLFQTYGGCYAKTVWNLVGGRSRLGSRTPALGLKLLVGCTPAATAPAPSLVPAVSLLEVVAMAVVNLLLERLGES